MAGEGALLTDRNVALLFSHRPTSETIQKSDLIVTSERKRERQTQLHAWVRSEAIAAFFNCLWLQGCALVSHRDRGSFDFVIILCSLSAVSQM